MKPKDVGTRNHKSHPSSSIRSGHIVSGTYSAQVIPKYKKVKSIAGKVIMVDPRGFGAKDHKSDPCDPDAKPEPNPTF